MKQKHTNITVYRIEHKDTGEGPYALLDEEDTPDDMVRALERSPTIETDGGFSDADRKAYDPAKHQFGFKEKEHAAKYFGPHALDRLSALGFKLVQKKAKKVWSSGQQAFYEPYEKGEMKKEGIAVKL